MLMRVITNRESIGRSDVVGMVSLHESPESTTTTNKMYAPPPPSPPYKNACSPT